MYRYLPFLLLLCFLMPSCGGKQETGDEQDSLAVADSDSIVLDTIDTYATPVAVPPKKADELFDDFVYAFMHNKKFQRSRINFPLRNESDSVNHPISAKAWVHDPLYAGRELYITVSTSKKAAALAKDTSINQVMVQEIIPSAEQVKQYNFARQHGEWRLCGISHTSLPNTSERTDFMSFYCRFIQDKDFQQQHVSDIVTFTSFDEEEGCKVEGTISAEQWPDFAPELPTDEVMCVRYGSDFAKSNQRIVNLASPSGDAGVTMTFNKKGEKWMLTSYEN